MGRHILSLVFAFAITAASSVATAQEGTGSASGIGVGVESMLTGPVGPTFVYQATNFHIDAIFAFDSNDNPVSFLDRTNELSIGGRIFFQVHEGEIADFSLGGGIGITTDDDGGPGNNNDDIDFHLEGGAKIRAFLAPNVALTASLGLGIVLDSDDNNNDDDDRVTFRGNLTGGFGIVYFFF